MVLVSVLVVSFGGGPGDFFVLVGRDLWWVVLVVLASVLGHDLDGGLGGLGLGLVLILVVVLVVLSLVGVVLVL